MKLYKIKYLLPISVLMLTVSCDDFLTENNPNAMTSTVFWNSLTDCDKGLTAVYNSFRSPAIYQLADENYRSDLTWPGFGRPNPSSISDSYYQTFTATSTAPNAKWNALYTGIFRANQVIESLNNLMPTFSSEADTKKSTQLMAQARFFRGLFHYYLYTSFNAGKIIIRDAVPQSESDYYKKTSPASEVITFVRQDLEYAYKNLPKKWATNIDLGRATAGAAATILGQSYLYEKAYDKAIPYFEDVIGNKEYGYKLVDNIGLNFTTKGEFNEESILEVSYSTDFKPEEIYWSEKSLANSYAVQFASSKYGGWRTVIPSCWLIMAYKHETLDYNDPRNKVVKKDGSEGYRKYSLRCSHSIALIDDEDMPYYGTDCSTGNVFNNKETAFFRKYTNWDIYTSESQSPMVNASGINLRLLRLADVYLMYAECLIKGGTNDGGVTEALKYINRVRHRSALQLLGKASGSEYPEAQHNELAYTSTELMNHLMYIERPLELSIEGHATRVIDMRRWNITKKRFEELSQQLFYAHTYAWLDADNVSRSEWASQLLDVEPSGFNGVVLQDFIIAAQNFNEKAHSYWPIPQNEIIANPQVLQ